MLSALSLHQPETVEAASEMLRYFGDDAAIYAGGTELLVLMKERLSHFSQLVDIKRIPELSGIRFDEENGELVIGALTTHRAIEMSPLVRERASLLAEVEAQVANIRVRHAGTIGGNLCFAEPHSDPATLFVAWDARFTLTSVAGSRTLAAADFFTGLLETARERDELLTTITFPVPRPHAATHNRDAVRSEASPVEAERILQHRSDPEREILRSAQNDSLSGAGSAYQRFKTHKRSTADPLSGAGSADQRFKTHERPTADSLSGAGSAYQRFKTHERPTAAVAVTLEIGGGQIRDARIVAGSVGIGPERLGEAEAMLIGQRPGSALFAGVSAAAAAAVFIEEEGFESTGYKRHLIEVLTNKALAQAAERAA